MDISVYLIELLRMHDCVIVPDLGGFVTNYRPAEMDLSNNSFNPPRKEIIFSSKLNRNDGLLVNHISETEGVGYLDARLMISEFVDETISRLENGEKIELALIGTLQYDKYEKLVFEAELKENLLLDAFGFDGFQFPHLRHDEIFISRRPLRNKEAVRPIFNNRRIKTIAVGVPLLLGLLLIPVKKNSWDIYNPFNYQISTTSPVITNPVVAPVAKLAESTEGVNKELKDENTIVSRAALKNEINTVTVKAANSEKYHLIGGCFKMKENAEKLVNHLRSEGYKSTIDQAASGNFIVTVQSYSDKNEAVEVLMTLREKEPKAGYWMSVK